jgi:methyl-accepting chemotaxis protein
MKIKLKIRQKIILFVLSVTMMLYIVAIGYIVTESRKTMLNDAVENAKLTAKLSAKEIERLFERDLTITRTLAQAFTVYKQMSPEQWQPLFKKMYFPILEANKDIYSIWDSWEFSGYVPNYDKEYGRYCVTLWRENDKILNSEETRSITGDPNLYGGFKKKNQEGLWDPYIDQGGAMQDKSERILMTTIASPIQVNGKFSGLVGLDISLKSLQDVVSKIEPVPGSFGFLVSTNGLIAGHPKNEFVNRPINEVYPEDFERENIGKVIEQGVEHSYNRIDEEGKTHFMCFAPIKAGNSYSYWSLGLSIPLDAITEKADRNQYISLMVGIIGLIILIIVLIIVANNLTRPLAKITKSLRKLSQGEISNDLLLKLKSGDEIEIMSEALNISIEGLNKKSQFAMEIGKGQLESDLDLLGENDVLGQSLLDMRNSLKKAKDEEIKRVADDQKRTWANEGFARFAEILRKNNDDLQQLSDEVLKNLVKYINGNQAALFLINHSDVDNPVLEATSIYAWDRKKHLNLAFRMGEGLVGACAIEQETIFLTEIPDNFITIASGLGESNPNCIILVPLKHDERIMGVIEIASFKIFEQHEIEFLEKVCESIAATISSVKINAKTLFLLEQSQQQAEEMQAQEEEMRQNMEELLATQEEMARKEKEIAWTMEAIDGLALVVEYDFKGMILNANSLLCSKSQFSKNELVGQHHSVLFEKKDFINSDSYRNFWTEMNNRRPYEGVMIRIDKNGKPFKVKGHCYPIFDDDGRPLKVVEVSIDISDLA